jgi:glutaminyl-peptide cyclotransferase
MNRRKIAVYLIAVGILFAIMLAWYGRAFLLDRQAASAKFDGDRAYADVQAQVAFGPRIPGSDAHAKVLEWMRAELESAGWQVEIQSSESMGHAVRNLLAHRNGTPPQIILGAHYDSRIYADRDPDPGKWTQPVPGADDGASGVAVLLELARTLPKDSVPVWLAFFDVEDNGDIPGWDWLLGSKAFVAEMTVKPQAMVLVDMVGDTDLSLPMEANSDPALRIAIWNTAAQLGYGDVFVPRPKYYIEDDHIPFIDAGIPSVDIIDIDYAYWHTVSDTPEHVSPRSLKIVGDVLLEWLIRQNRQSN